MPRVSVFLIGFLLGGMIGGDIGWSIAHKNSVAFLFGCFLGALFALLLLCVEALMFLAMGSLASYIFFTQALAPLVNAIDPSAMNNQNIKWGLLILTIIVGGAVAYKVKRWIMIVVTAFIGSYFFINAIGYFRDKRQLDALWLLPKTVSAKYCQDQLCKYMYVGWFLCFVFGFAVQFFAYRKKKAGKGKRNKYSRYDDEDYKAFVEMRERERKGKR
eukprot:TRINITY_DN8462_c0_g1_i2.p1 TRINITY_DN8462_c0_g1~~TRINITY_DN8462_c0_g1_i2.p1  ORF type:complete len:251 (-),score=66.60 TRINITY_DN8462_c0_g1_i2:67-714(-)